VSRVVDLALPFDPSNPRVHWERLRRIEVDGWEIIRVTFDTYAGTHMDAPSHQVPNAPTLDAMDLSKCMGPAFVCDLRHIPANQDIEAADFAPWAEQIGPGARVIYRTDWTERVGASGYRDAFPCPSVACAAWLAARGIALLGMDTPSVGPVYRTPTDVIAVHTPLLNASVIVEELCNLRAIEAETFHLVALPLRLTGRDGSPTRAVAVLD